MTLAYPATEPTATERWGKVVKAIDEHSPAAGALVVGDIVHAINGVSLSESSLTPVELIREGARGERGVVVLDVTLGADAPWLDTEDKAALAAAYSRDHSRSHDATNTSPAQDAPPSAGGKTLQGTLRGVVALGVVMDMATACVVM